MLVDSDVRNIAFHRRHEVAVRGDGERGLVRETIGGHARARSLFEFNLPRVGGVVDDNALLVVAVPAFCARIFTIMGREGAIAAVRRGDKVPVAVDHIVPIAD